MGVRGLTTYIAKRAEQFLEPYELHDCDLVIDGDNLASQLFKRTEYRLSAFGGNYDSYFATVCEFFVMLKKCNVQSYVLLDGGYEQRKMRTVRSRLLGRIGTIKNIVPLDHRRLAIPLMMREVFVDALRKCNIPFYRCMFEADDEIAILARKLQCPVFSYDSDFYIHNVMYIPNVTLTHKVYKKTVKNASNYEIEIMNRSKNKKGRQNVKKVVVQQLNTDENVTLASEPTESYFYMDCSIYEIKNLLKRRKMGSQMAPLFAALIGNDYVERRAFRKFYSGINLPHNKKNFTPQQQRIEKMFEWLKNETVQSAMTKIVERLKLEDRKPLIRQIKAAMSGYNMEASEAFEYFGLEDNSIDEDDVALGFAIEDLLKAKEEIIMESDEGEGTDLENEESVDEENNTSEEEKEEEEEEEGNAEPDIVELPEDAVIAEENSRPHYKNNNSATFEFPDWFKQKYQSAQLPRFAADLIFSKLFINYPQVEDVLKKDSNEISLDILFCIFGLLQYPEKSRLSYLTRTIRTTSYHFKIYAVDKMPTIEEFDPLKRKNVELFRQALRNLKNGDTVLDSLPQLPEHFRLYALAIIFWMDQSSGNELHLHSALLCYLLLKVIDKSAGQMHRNVDDFHKKFRQQLVVMRNQKSVDCANTTPPDLFTPISPETYRTHVKNVTKSESLLALSNLVAYTTVGEKWQRRHVDFNRTLIHSLAQLQSVCYNLYTLNTLANCPFEQLRMSECFNGFFIYQMYTNLKLKTMEPLIYIRNHLFQHSPNLMVIYASLFNFCTQFSRKFNGKMELLKEQVAQAGSDKKAMKKRSRKKNKNEENIVESDKASSEESDSGEYKDLNNAFSQLLSI